MRRPLLGPELDPSRAADRAADPRGWRLDDAARAALAGVIAERRDVRRFRPDPVEDALLERVLEAAHRAPSVGLSQPWRFVVVRSTETRARVRALAERERARQAPRFGPRARAFLDQKVEGVLEAPVGVCVCCVPPPEGTEVLGRGTIPATDIYSTACAIQNLWLTARAEGLGVGWVSFYRPDELRAVLGIPDAVEPVAWLCVGWPDERPVRPGLERAGWARRRPLADVLHRERWPAGAADPAPAPLPDAAARIAARDRADRLVKPAGSLGVLEDLVERWSAATGAPPPAPLRAAHLVCAADHGHAGRGTSLFDGAVSGQVAAAAARGETAIGVLARARGETLVVADVGLRGATPPGCVDCRCAPAGTADYVTGPAMTAAQRDAALAAGARVARGLLDASGADCLVLGEIGIGNTATAAALLCALTGARPDEVVGRGTGLDAQGVARKVQTVAAALARAATDDPAEALRELGGLELAALVGAIHAAHDARVPAILDGLAVGVAALVAVRLRPTCREWLVAGHRSAEPAHALALSELGLEPLLDLRLRLGEASGAALALPLIEQAGRLHREMATFAEAGVMTRSAGLALLAGLALDEALGDPARLHPVAGFGSVAAAAERVVYRPSRASGAAYAATAVALPTALAVAVQRRVGRRAALATACLAVTLGGRTLRHTALRMADLLDAGDLAGARALAPALVARRPDGLGAGELARATVESLAENTADAVGGPLVWTAVAGAPGAVAYRAANTLDAMVGYRDERYRAFGWAAARLDDALNWPVARLTAAATVAAAPLAGADARGAAGAWRRDGHRHPSPNGGQVEAAFAGALGVRLGGANRYGDAIEHRPHLGDGPPPDTAAIRRAARLSACVGWLLAAALALVAGRRAWA